jgi:hypothetical protein
VDALDRIRSAARRISAARTLLKTAKREAESACLRAEAAVAIVDGASTEMAEAEQLVDHAFAYWRQWMIEGGKPRAIADTSGAELPEPLLKVRRFLERAPGDTSSPGVLAFDRVIDSLGVTQAVAILAEFEGQPVDAQWTALCVSADRPPPETTT